MAIVNEKSIFKTESDCDTNTNNIAKLLLIPTIMEQIYERKFTLHYFTFVTNPKSNLSKNKPNILPSSCLDMDQFSWNCDIGTISMKQKLRAPSQSLCHQKIKQQEMEIIRCHREQKSVCREN